MNRGGDNTGTKEYKLIFLQIVVTFGLWLILGEEMFMFQHPNKHILHLTFWLVGQFPLFCIWTTNNPIKQKNACKVK